MLFKTQECCDPFENNIKTYLQGVRWDKMYWIDLAQSRDGWWTLVNAVTNLWVPQNADNLLTSQEFCSMELLS